MVCRFQCANCGERGWIMSDLPAVAPRCLRCRHRLEVEPAAIDRSGESSATDESIISWLSQPPPVPVPRRDPLATCAFCGFEGLLQSCSPKGDTFCPTCLAIYRAKPEPVQQRLDCPNCGQPIEIHESDRGKTVVCLACNYFLGCVLRPEKRRFGTLPFLNVLHPGGERLNFGREPAPAARAINREPNPWSKSERIERTARDRLH